MLGSESAPHDLDCAISPVLLLSGCLALKVSRLEHFGTKVPIPILASRGKYCQGQTSLSYLPAKRQGQSCRAEWSWPLSTLYLATRCRCGTQDYQDHTSRVSHGGIFLVFISCVFFLGRFSIEDGRIVLY